MLAMNSTLTRPALGTCITVPFKPATGAQVRRESRHGREEGAASTWYSDLLATASLAIIVGYIAWNVVL